MPARELSRVASGEPDPLVFISSVMSENMREARDIAVAAVRGTRPFTPWAFEFTPASSDDAESTYIERVKEASVLIWLVQDCTPPPVEVEVRTAMELGKRLLVFRLPSTDQPDDATKSLIKAVGDQAKWSEVHDLGELDGLIRESLGDETKRAMQRSPDGRGRIADLDQLRRASKARIIAKCLAAGLDEKAAVGIADDPTCGSPPSELDQADAGSLLFLVGDIGAGKSLIAERVFQSVIAGAEDDILAPWPIFVRAVECTRVGLETIVQDQRRIGVGVRLIIDGLDEVEIHDAHDIVERTRSVVGSSIKSSAVLTSRPLPEIFRASETVTAESLTDEEAGALIGRAAGHPPYQLFRLDQGIRDLVRRPLFALLLGSLLRLNDGILPRSRRELMSGLIEHTLARSPNLETDEAQQALQDLAIELVDSGSHWSSSSLGVRSGTRRALVESRLVTASNGTLTFTLEVFKEWFALEALLSGRGPSGPELVEEPRRIDAWNQAISMALEVLEFDEACALLEPVAAEAPHHLALVIEGATRADGAPLPGTPKQAGQMLRLASRQIRVALGPSVKLASLEREDATQPPIGVSLDDNQIVVAHYHGADDVPEVVLLNEFGFTGQANRDWPEVRFLRARGGNAWPWLTMLDDAKSGLESILEGRQLPIVCEPMANELGWTAAQVLANRGSISGEPIPAADVVSELDKLALKESEHSSYRWFHSLPEAIHLALKRANASDGHIHPPWQTQDESFGGWIWSGYSDKALQQRTQQVFEAALEIYSALVEACFTTLAPGLRHFVLQPLRFHGVLTPAKEGSLGPGLSYFCSPLPTTSGNVVDITFDPPDSPPLDADFGPKLNEQIRSLRPDAPRWIHASHTSTMLDIFGSAPATALAYTWLHDDLATLGWLDAGSHHYQW